MQACQCIITAIYATFFILSNASSSAYPRVSGYPGQRIRTPFTSLSYNEDNRVERPRLSVVEWDQYNERDVQGRNTYAFGYDVQNPITDDTHYRHEERLPNGTVVGSYGYVTPDGNAHVVNYIADHLGYRAHIKTSKRFADVKPIPVNIDQALADELASAELLLQNDNYNKNYNSEYVPLQKSSRNKIFVNNRKEEVYAVRNNLAEAVPRYVKL